MERPVAAQTSGAVDTAWMIRHHAPRSNANDDFADMTIDVQGNVYVIGRSTNRIYGRSILLVKYDAGGAELWSAEYTAGEGEESRAVAVAVDAAQNVYVVGHATGGQTRFDIVTLKFNAAGERQWLARYNGAANTDDEAAALAVSATGHVFVLGESAESDRSCFNPTIPIPSAM